ncbi:MAG: RsmG family class I SAM-dependent methyltransferase, partial [Clostridia bacterium]
MEILKNYLLNNGFENDEKLNAVLEKFKRFYELLIEWNNKFNLTTITEIDDAQNKHFVDSLLGEPLIAQGANVCDIGVGAGFPSFPIAIIRA